MKGQDMKRRMGSPQRGRTPGKGEDGEEGGQQEGEGGCRRGQTAGMGEGVEAGGQQEAGRGGGTGEMHLVF